MPDNFQINDLQNKINTIEEKLPAILDDFKKYYVFFNKNPTYNEYQQIYQNLKNELDSINGDLLKVLNELGTNTQKIGDSLLQVNILIEKEKAKNIALKAIENDVNNNYNGSTTMIDEYKQIYNENYFNNVFLFIGIIVGIIALIKVFSGKSNITSMNSANSNSTTTSFV
jgi:CCR4-NOT transcriptional regulation complex NOT5 subunit